MGGGEAVLQMTTPCPGNMLARITETNAMTPDHDQSAQDEPASASEQQQQQQPPVTEGHGGQGSDSAMKQMRVWEQRRAMDSGGKRRQGPQ
jgi:hypothetical protein